MPFSAFATWWNHCRTGRIYVWLALTSLLGSVAGGVLHPGHLPVVHDEYAYLFAGKTLSEGRLTNPTHPFWRFFEAHHILMHPSTMAKYPPGQGLMLGLGFWLGNPIWGVWLTSLLLTWSMAWMLRGFFSIRWATAGAFLTVVLLGVNHYWAQTYWGGSLAATGGALVFGGVRRALGPGRTRDGLLLGLGVIILAFTRPLEGLLASIVPAIALLSGWVRSKPQQRHQIFRRVFLPGAAVLLAGFSFMAYDNFVVTGSPWRLPYVEYEDQYLRYSVFFWRTTPSPPPTINQVMADYRLADWTEVFSAVLILDRWQDLLGGTLGPLFGLFAIAGVVGWRTLWSRWALVGLLVGSAAIFCVVVYLTHYEAPIVALLLLFTVAGARVLFLRLPRPWRRPAPFACLVLILQLCLMGPSLHAAWQARGKDQRNFRQRTEEALRNRTQDQLVFVRLKRPYYLYECLVYNEPRIDAAHIVWAWDRGPEENQLLLNYFPQREARLMTVTTQGVTFSSLRR